jgi:hypothetical protein
VLAAVDDASQSAAAKSRGRAHAPQNAVRRPRGDQTEKTAGYYFSFLARLRAILRATPTTVPCP